MIKVRRKRPAPPALSSDAAEAERKRAKALYRVKKNAKKPFPFEVYKDTSVRQALEKMFRNKCGYCESKIGATDEADVEHWRPKGPVSDPDTRERSYPGYYWLASEWENLVLACLKCNRPRRYRAANAEDDEETWIRTGKAMFFPLAAGDVRAARQGDESVEHPLLLDPCRDRPERHLEFVVFDSVGEREGLVEAKGRNRTRERGEASINVYGLNRELLLNERREVLKTMQFHLAEIRESSDKLDALSPNSPRRVEYEARIIRNVEQLARRLTPDSPYLSMARQTLHAFLEQEPGLRAAVAPLLKR